MKNYLIFIILVLAFILRFYKLGDVPLSLNWDEVSNSYNAYSILKTGKDQYGNFLPLTNRSFDDYKPPLYMYLNVVSISIFNLNSLATRLPSALLGTLTVLSLYLLVRNLFRDNKVALVSAFFLSISSWHLQFSRVGFEANVGLFMTVFSFMLFIYAVKSLSKIYQAIFFISSAFFMGLSMYSYHSERIFIPLMLMVSVFLFRTEIKKVGLKVIILSAMLGLIIVAPLKFLVPQEAIIKRFTTTTQDAITEDINQSIKYIELGKERGLIFSNLIYNRRIFIARSYLKNYLEHFDINFLFTRGDSNDRHHVENMGMMYHFQLPLLIIGIYFFIKKRSQGKSFFLGWLILSPIPAMTGNVAPHAVRSFTMVIPLIIITSFTFVNVYDNVKFKFLSLVIVLIAVVTSLFIYLHNYYIHYPTDHSGAWQYGYSQAASTSHKLAPQYNKVHITPSVEQAYIFWLFYNSYDPKKFQQTGSTKGFENFVFNSEEQVNQGELVVAPGLPESYKIIDIIYAPNGEKVVEIGEPI